MPTAETAIHAVGGWSCRAPKLPIEISINTASNANPVRRAISAGLVPASANVATAFGVRLPLPGTNFEGNAATSRLSKSCADNMLGMPAAAG